MKATELRLGSLYLDPFGNPCLCVCKTLKGCYVNWFDGNTIKTVEVHDDPAGDCFVVHPEPNKCLGGRYNLVTLERFSDA